MDDFRNRSAKSMLTLPLVAVIAGVVWVLPDPRSAWLWGGFAIVCALTYTLRELNNRFQLLRIRSRLVSATFLTLFAALPDLHPAERICSRHRAAAGLILPLWFLSAISPRALYVSRFLLPFHRKFGFPAATCAVGFSFM